VTEVIRADGSDIAVLSQVIADAFFDLPPSQWLVPDPGERQAIFPRYFRIFVEHALANGIVHTTPDRAAAALWIPAGDEPPPAPERYDERLREVTTPWTTRFAEFDAALDRHHPVGTAHHHLALLGVRPGAQGRGIGTALLQAHHQVLDQAGVAAYLEAASHRTRRLYRRHGYADLGPPICLSDELQMFPMLRQPPLAATPSPVALGASAALDQRGIR
jgi:GNAT superfamily N-acetyltransferase